MEKDKGNTLLLIVITLLLIGDVLFLYWAKNDYIRNITLSFSKTSTSISGKKDIKNLTLKDKDLRTFRRLIRKIDYEPCDFEPGDEFVLNIDSKYTITFGNVNGNYLGVKKDLSKKSSSQTFIVPKKLYDESKKLALKYKQKKVNKNSTNNLEDYIFKLDGEKKYKITTDSKYLTVRNDGGSHLNVYYNIDLDKRIYEKVNEVYKANLGGKPETTILSVYKKYINKELNNEIENLIYNLKENDDINDNNNDMPYKIENLYLNKTIYNKQSILKLKDVLDKVDKYQNKLLFTLESTKLNCSSPKLFIYDDSTFAYKNKKDEISNISISRGTFDYDVSKILDESNNNSGKKIYKITTDTEIKDISETSDIEEFLKSINIDDMHKCLN